MARVSHPRKPRLNVSIETAKKRVAFWTDQPDSIRRRKWLSVWEATLYQLTRIQKREVK